MFWVKSRFCRHLGIKVIVQWGVSGEAPRLCVLTAGTPVVCVSRLEHPLPWPDTGVFHRPGIMCYHTYFFPTRAWCQHVEEYWHRADTLKTCWVNEGAHKLNREQMNEQTHLFWVSHERNSTLCNHNLRWSLLKQQCNVSFCLPKLKYILQYASYQLWDCRLTGVSWKKLLIYP